MSAPWDGRPANPDADGWHWLLVAHGIGHPFPMLWAADGRMWDAGDACWAHYEDIATRWRYLGPCLTPADHAAAVQAEREACAAGLDAAAKMLRLRDAEDRGIPDHMGHSFEANAAEAWAKSIRARGDTSALAGLLAEEFHKGWRKGQDDALESAKPEIAATASALAAAVEAARDEGRIEGATLAAAELAAAVEAARREGVEQAARWHDDRAVARRHAGLDQAADEHRAYAAAIRARSGGKEGA